MFGISMGELAIILVVAIIVLGPEKLQELTKDLGPAIRKFRRIRDDIKEDLILELDLDLEEKKKPKEKIHEGLKPKEVNES